MNLTPSLDFVSMRLNSNMQTLWWNFIGLFKFNPFSINICILLGLSRVNSVKIVSEPLSYSEFNFHCRHCTMPFSIKWWYFKEICGVENLNTDKKTDFNLKVDAFLEFLFCLLYFHSWTSRLQAKDFYLYSI